MLCIEEGQDHEDVEEAQLPYRHVQSLGHGHSGNVEEVRDQHTNKTYARKTIPIPYSKAKRVERTRVFQNEVKIIRGLGKHRHIVSVFATYVTKRHFGIVLEPVASGGDLERFLAEYWNDIDEPNGSDSSAQRTATMAAVLEQGFGCLAAGLAFMHANKIRHKDIKPHNILVHEGRMIYTDFGYSFNSTGFSRSTTVGTPSFFTRRYSAPEVLEHENRNSRSDIFSLGCVFFDMLSTLTRTLHHEEIEEFAFIIETMHVHIAAMQVPASVSTVPPAVIAMTASEASKRPCAAHLTIAILESPGSCCLGCKTTCKDKWIMSAPEDDCHGLSIMKGRCDRAQEATEQEFVHATPTPSYHNAKDDTSSQDQIKDLSEAKRISSIVNQWTWSEEYQNHYFTTIDHSGAYAYTWADQPSRSAGSQQANTTTQDGQSSHSDVATRSRLDSGYPYDANMAPAAPMEVMNELRFRGTPDRGWYEPLDSSYRMRTRTEAHTFFVKGRVFAMLWAETASATMKQARIGTENTAITIGRFGEQVYSQIRRFVVVKVNRDGHFVYACAISTYGARGTLKHGCTASEHTIVYLSGSQPIRLQGEWEKGMRKDPIEIEAASETEEMSPASRLRFGKIHSIEWNVKVREIGVVARKHMSRLLKYYHEEDVKGFDDDETFAEPYTSEPIHLQGQTNYASAKYTQANHLPEYASPRPYQDLDQH